SHAPRGVAFSCQETTSLPPRSREGREGFWGVGGGATSVVAAQPPNKTSRASRLRGGLAAVTLLFWFSRLNCAAVSRYLRRRPAETLRFLGWMLARTNSRGCGSTG